MLRHVTRLWTDALDFIYPPRCLACAAGEQAPETPHLCVACLQALDAEPMPPPVDFVEQFLRRGLQKAFDECRAAWHYSEKMQRLVHAMKYEGKLSIARLLAKGMSMRMNHLNHAPGESMVIVPVPMHARRRRERGYNQSALLASELSKWWKLRVDAKSLRRVRDTLQQALLSAEERHRNVEDAFAATPPDAFVNKTVFLIDDVVTTGSTMNACAQALKSAGAARVCVLAAARA